MHGDDIIGLYRARTYGEICAATTHCLRRSLAFHAFLIWACPDTFQNEMYVYPPTAKNRQAARDYLTKHLKHDLWLRRSPIHPKLRCVRHSDFTGPKVLKSSVFYRQVLKPIGSFYGASILAWRRDQWLATITLHRNPEQGDFTRPELAVMRDFQGHFAASVRRLAEMGETALQRDGLDTFIQSIPSGFVLISWSLRTQHYNQAAQWRVSEMEHGVGHGFKKKKTFTLPQEILQRLENMKKLLRQRENPRRVLYDSFISQREPNLRIRLSFIPSKKQSFHPGLFLVVLEEVEKEVHLSQLSLLTRSEQVVYRHLMSGLTNQQISEKLRKSLSTIKNQNLSIFSKLGAKGRLDLIARHTGSGILPG